MTFLCIALICLGAGLVGLLFFCEFFLPVYFAPTIVADKNNHPQRQAIFVLNSLAGWTFLGWVAAMVRAHVTSQPGH